jgi:hypothetical protein
MISAVKEISKFLAAMHGGKTNYYKRDTGSQRRLEELCYLKIGYIEVILPLEMDELRGVMKDNERISIIIVQQFCSTCRNEILDNGKIRMLVTDSYLPINLSISVKYETDISYIYIK